MSDGLNKIGAVSEAKTASNEVFYEHIPHARLWDT